MSRGIITDWTFTNLVDNQGVIAGCSPDVHGGFFGFTIDDVADTALRNYLLAHPHLSAAPDCSQPPSIFWVSFTPVGGSATNISRLFGS